MSSYAYTLNGLSKYQDAIHRWQYLMVLRSIEPYVKYLPRFIWIYTVNVYWEWFQSVWHKMDLYY